MRNDIVSLDVRLLGNNWTYNTWHGLEKLPLEFRMLKINDN